MLTVQFIALGPVEHKVDFRKVLEVCNKSQSHYEFVLGDAITTLGDPQHRAPDPQSVPDLQYRVDELSQLIVNNREDHSVHVFVGVVDAFVLDELFSSVGSNNRCIIVSLKGNDVDIILKSIGKTYAEYVVLEAAIQLLALEYRLHTRQTYDPEECSLPWHKEMRGCIFDYFGLKPDNPTKLMEPRLCAQCQSLLAETNIRGALEESCLAILRVALMPTVRSSAVRVARSDFTLLVLGAWLGATLGTTTRSWLFFGALTISLVVAFVAVIGIHWFRSRKRVEL